MLQKSLQTVVLGLMLLTMLGSSIAQSAEPVGESLPAVDPVQLKTDKLAVVQGNTAFAFDLYAKLSALPEFKDQNLFLSPYSISTALAMTSAGARSQTLTQMEQALRFPVEQKRLHPAFGALLHETKPGKGCQLHLANALWCQAGYPFRDLFLNLNETYYNGKPTSVDFIKAAEPSRQTINAWVEKQTKERIKELLKPGMVTEDTRLVLTNAIWFHGNWEHKFDKKQTRDFPFRVGKEKEVMVPMMYGPGVFKWVVTETFAALELPYADKQQSMLVIMPRREDGLAELGKTLSADKLNQWLGQMKPTGIDVALPRFQVVAEFKLNDVLKTMGMSDAFSGAADFTGITEAKPFCLTAVVHKAFVQVNEEGTEAAGATAVIGGSYSAPPSFVANRPFFFLIRDQRTGSILFLGRVLNPKTAS